MLHEILPFPQEVNDNRWTNEHRHVPAYRPYYARRAKMGFDLDDIFDIGTTFINGQPIRHVYTDLMIRSEEQTPDNIPTPINLSVIMNEE